jgi:septal ring factor EnvC (AmiA/AmiB activator)
MFFQKIKDFFASIGKGIQKTKDGVLKVKENYDKLSTTKKSVIKYSAVLLLGFALGIASCFGVYNRILSNSKEDLSKISREYATLNETYKRAGATITDLERLNKEHETTIAGLRGSEKRLQDGYRELEKTNTNLRETNRLLNDSVGKYEARTKYLEQLIDSIRSGFGEIQDIISRLTEGTGAIKGILEENLRLLYEVNTRPKS